MSQQPTVSDVEALASELYQTVDDSRGPATNSMDPRVLYLGSPDGLHLIRNVLSSSTSSYAIFLCSQVLRNQQLRHSSGTGALSHEEMIALKDFLATVIMKRFEQGLNSYCVKNLIATLCALIKNGLADIPRFMLFPAEVCSAFGSPQNSTSTQCGLLQHPLGITILESLVQEVGILNTCRPVVEHRRTNNTFRDECLTSIFSIAVENLRWIHVNRGNVDPTFLSCSVALMKSVLSFDFVGLVVDDGDEEPTTLNFPSNWRETFITPGFFDMFWDLFEMCGPPVNLALMQCLNCVCCARRSLFQSDGERSAWLERMMIGHIDIITREIWLEDANIIGEFCRLMLRMKPNYQLKEYLERENYCRWLETAAEFSCRVFRGWRGTFPGITHLCGMWTKLLGSQSYAPKDYPTHFERVAPMVVIAYLESRMDMAEAFATGSVRGSPSRGTHQHQGQRKSSTVTDRIGLGCQPTAELLLENPLDDEGNELKQQLESVSGVLRSCLSSVVPTVASYFSTAAAQFAASLQSGMVDVVAEERVAWLLYVFGSLIRTPNTGEDFECEALMISSCFDLVSLVCRRSDAFPPQQPGGSAQHLVMASLHFLHCFRLIYVGDPTSQASKTLCKLQDKLELHQMSCNEMQSKLLDFLMSTIVSNLRHWSCSTAVLEETLNLFKELSSGFSSARQLLEIPSVKHLFSADGAAVFPFQQSAESHRHRTRYRHTITSIFFLECISSEQFAGYMNPLTNVLDTVLLSLNSGVSFLDQPQARDSILGTLCDIRGVSSACMGRRNFHILFDYLHPKLLGTLGSLAELVASRNFTCDDRLETQLLRLACEISFNRCQRILFGPHSAGGFHLFHFVSDLVQLFGQKKIARIKAILLQASSSCVYNSAGRRQLVSTVERLVAASSGALGDSHEWLVKGSQLVLQLACCGLSGAYCNFGVLALYRDDKLNNMLCVVWQLLVMFDFEDVVSSPKLAKEYFNILEQLFSIHCDFVARNPSDEIMHILRVLEASMQAVSLPSTAQNAATTAISHFANFLFERFQVKADSSLVFERCLSQHDPQYLERMLRVVFLNVVSEEGANQWSLSQPLFPLILLCPEAYMNFTNDFVRTQLRSSGSPEELQTRRNRAIDLFDRLMDGVDRCNERKFRDKFQANLTQFRSAIKQLM